MNTWLSTRAIVAVCRTFASDTVASATLLRRLLTPEALAQRGYEELPRLAHEIKYIIPYDASLVGEIYRAAFGYAETSKEATALGASRILSLTSNRAQDYDGALYSLADAYQRFLDFHPLEATRALIGIVEMDQSIARYRAKDAHPSNSFMFHGKMARLVDDYTFVWDHDSLHSQDAGVRILNAWCEHLPQLAMDDMEQFNQVLEFIGEQNTAAIIWRRLLVVGAQHPETIGRALRELLWATPILVGQDTYQPVGQCIKAVFALLPQDERTQIERAILGIVKPGDNEDERSRASWHEKRLLGCLPEGNVVLGETRETLRLLKDTGQAVTNDPPIEIDELDEDEIPDALNLGFRRDTQTNPLGEALEHFRAAASANSSQAPTEDALAKIIPAAKKLVASIDGNEGEQANDQQRRVAWYAIAHACTWLGRLGRSQLNDTAYTDLAELLVKASRQVEIAPEASEEAEFAHSPSWGENSHVCAAEGLMFLARFGKVSNAPLQETISRLAVDVRPAVRLQVANGIHLLNVLDPALAWQLIEERGAVEPNVQVAARVVHSLYKMRSSDPDRAASTAKLIYDRFAAVEHSEGLRNNCTDIWASLVIQAYHKPSQAILDDFTQDISQYHTEVSHAAQCMRNVLNNGTIDQTDAHTDDNRKRAMELVLQFTHAAHTQIDALIATDPSLRSQAEQQRIVNLAKTASVIGDQVYFASGAFDEKKDEAAVLDPRLKARFYSELSEVIDELAEIGLAGVAYHFVEMYGSYVAVDPRSIFLRLERLIAVADKRDGLAFEGLAVDAMVKVVSRYLADYRDLLRNDDACRAALISILDTFVIAGWPQAWQLTYKLGDIDR